MTTTVEVEFLATAVSGLSYERMFRFVLPVESEWMKFSFSALQLAFGKQEIERNFYNHLYNSWKEFILPREIDKMIDGRSDNIDWVSDITFDVKEIAIS